MNAGSVRGCIQAAGEGVVVLSPEDIFNGSLDNIDCLIVPGGAHRPAISKLHHQGRAHLKRFVASGGAC